MAGCKRDLTSYVQDTLLFCLVVDFSMAATLHCLNATPAASSAFNAADHDGPYNVDQARVFQI